MDKSAQKKIIIALIIGFIAMLVACVLLFFCYFIYGVFFIETIEESQLYQTCLSAPSSDGCRTCIELDDIPEGQRGSELASGLCGYCEYEYSQVADGVIEFNEVDEKCRDNLK